jgi:membrane-associated phospholipid phosphatase
MDKVTQVLPADERDDGTPRVDRFRVFTLRWLLLFVLTLFVALVVDVHVQDNFRVHVWYIKHESTFWHLAKQPGELWFTTSIALMLAIFNRLRWRWPVVLLIGSTFSALCTALLKWASGRTRPVVIGSHPFEFDWFRGGFEGLFNQTNLAMPSGHATQAFCTAALLSLVYPRGRLIWFCVASFTALHRVIELAHHPSDVVVGAFFGIVGLRSSYWLCLVVTSQQSLQLPSSFIHYLACLFGWPVAVGPRKLHYVNVRSSHRSAR